MRALQVGPQVGGPKHGTGRLAVSEGLDARGREVKKPAAVAIVDIDDRRAALVRLRGQLFE